MNKPSTYTMSFAKVYPLYIAKAKKMGVPRGKLMSEPQTISKKGTYVFDIDISANAYDAETLCTIYLKDVACAAADEKVEEVEALPTST